MNAGVPAERSQVIVVAGATGRQGGAVARRLIADGWVVRGLSRDPKSRKAARVRAAGVEVVQADMADRDSLAPALAGAYGLFSVQNPMICGHEMEVVQGKNLADVAAEAGVQHVVYGSAGPGEPHTGIQQWDAKREIEDHMRHRGLAHTILRPMAFMELMTDKAFYPSVSVWYVMPKLVGWHRPLPWVSVEDLAVIGATVFANPNRYVGRDLPIAADTKSLDDCHSLWREVTGRPPHRFPMPTGLFERFVGKDTTRMWRWLRTNPVEVDPRVALEIHPGMLTVGEWLLQHAAPERSRVK